MGKVRLANAVATQRFVRGRVRRYSDLAGLVPGPKWAGPTPRVVFSIDTYVALGGDRSSRKTHATDTGFNDPDLGIICVNLREHRIESIKGDVAYVSRGDADDTAAHEVVHLRWPSGPDHNDLFYRRVLALRAGHRCGRPRTRIPEAFR